MKKKKMVLTKKEGSFLGLSVSKDICLFLISLVNCLKQVPKIEDFSDLSVHNQERILRA